MFKKITFTFLTLLILYSIIAAGYRYFEPEQTASSNTSNTIDYASLKDYITSTGDASIHYLLFYSSDNENAVYVKDSILTQAEADTHLQLSSLIEIVDVTNLDESMKINRLSEDWGISSVPAFAAISLKNGKPVVNNKLEWDDKNPISVESLEQWLKDNSLYTSGS